METGCLNDIWDERGGQVESNQNSSDNQVDYESKQSDSVCSDNLLEDIEEMLDTHGAALAQFKSKISKFEGRLNVQISDLYKHRSFNNMRMNVSNEIDFTKSI